MASDSRPKRDRRLLERYSYVPTAELEVFLRVPPGTLGKWAARGYGPKVSAEGFYDTEDVKAWLTGQQVREDGSHGH